MDDPESVAHNARLLALVESGELSSPRLLELWRDLNLALVAKQEAERDAMAADTFGTDWLDPDSEYGRASARHSALFAAVVAEAELLLLNDEDSANVEPSVPDDLVASFEQVGLSSVQAHVAVYCLNIAAELVKKTGGSGPSAPEFRWTKEGTVLMRFYILSGGADPFATPHTLEIDAMGRYRNIIDRESKKRHDLGPRPMKVRRRQWTTLDWLGPPDESDLVKAGLRRT